MDERMEEETQQPQEPAERYSVSLTEEEIWEITAEIRF